MTEETLFDPAAALEQLRHDAAVRRKSVFHRSRLDRYAFELHELIRVGARPVELQHWLRKERRCVVALSTVTRWIKRNAD